MRTPFSSCSSRIPRKSPATAIGGLYAFEAQQPATARYKLDGLRLHYEIPAAGETYFETHADDDHEAVDLLEKLMTLEPAQQERALAACEAVAKAFDREMVPVDSLL